MTTRATPAAAAAVTTVCVPRTLSADRSATGVSSDQSTARCTTASAPGQPLRQHGVAHVADAPGDLARAGRSSRRTSMATTLPIAGSALRRASSARPMTPAAPVTTTVAPLRRLRGLRGDCTGTTGAAVPTSPAVAGSVTASVAASTAGAGLVRLRAGFAAGFAAGFGAGVRRAFGAGSATTARLGGARVRSRGRRAHRGLGHSCGRSGGPTPRPALVRRRRTAGGLVGRHARAPVVTVDDMTPFMAAILPQQHAPGGTPMSGNVPFGFTPDEPDDENKPASGPGGTPFGFDPAVDGHDADRRCPASSSAR